MFGRIRSYWKFLGPGLVTGAADDDPSGIATYSQTGALFGYTQLWAVFFSYPFMTVMQEMCGRIGMVTGEGLASVIRKRFSREVLWGAVSLLIIANVINIGADLGAMAASLALIVPMPFWVLLACITVFMLGLQIIVPYPTYAKVLKYLALCLFAYIVAAFLVESDWSRVLHATFVPHFALTKEYVLNIAAFLGTTISPYLFFWQADEEVEEEIANGEIVEAGQRPVDLSDEEVRQMRIDTSFGMFVSNLVAFFIIVTVAATLGVSGILSIDTAADAAQALRPIAGDFAFLLFALGVVGTGLLAVPVLSGSVGYAVSEALSWKAGLGKRFGQARGFYIIITAATLIGLLVNFSSIGSMQLLYYSAMLNGVLAPPLMIIILLLANDSTVMGRRVNGTFSNFLGWIITGVMALVGIAAVASLFV